MTITKTFYAQNRKEWRAWLEKHHTSEKEIWLIYYRKETGKQRIPYNDAVEEALCFGWIDSTAKGIDKERFAQRFTPRKPKSNWSPMNLERVRRLIKDGKMTPSGLSFVPDNVKKSEDTFAIPDDILQVLKENKDAWKYFQDFPLSYKRIRVGWIDGARKRPKEFQKRLNYFIKMTSQNKKFGMIQ